MVSLSYRLTVACRILFPDAQTDLRDGGNIWSGVPVLPVRGARPCVVDTAGGDATIRAPMLLADRARLEDGLPKTPSAPVARRKSAMPLSKHRLKAA
jgi:hypothetical protein